jgi:aryl-alcohol dehydrogenase-like predicted oxidoreductase
MIAKAPFGSTGHQSTRTLFGAAALSDVTQAEADRTMELVLDHGINHIDVAASYGDAELRLGPWMERRRGEFFLASKTGERSYAAARDEIRRSLERLRTDRLDLIQLHNLAQVDEWELAMGEDGALRACVEARDEGLVRFIGVTGHGLGIAAMHLRSLERFPFDSVLFPYSYVLLRDEGYRADVEALLAVCRERGVATQTIKSLTRRPWGEQRQTRATWYEPLEDPADIEVAVHWVLGREGLFLNTVGDIHVLPRVLEAAARFAGPVSDEAMREVVERRGMEPLFTR